MANIPDAASYVQPLIQGLQVGNQWAANSERRREALADEELRKQQFTVAQQEQAIRNAQAAREAQDYIATQKAQAGLPDRIQELMAPPAAPVQEGDIPAEERGVQVGQGMTQEQAHRQAMAEFLARTPVSQWNHIAPVQQAAAREAYYEGMPAARQAVQDTRNEGLKSVAEIRAQVDREKLEEAARHNAEVEALHKAAADQNLEPLYHPDTKKFIGYKSKAGAPHFMPASKDGDGVAAALAGSGAGSGAAATEPEPIPSKKEQLKAGGVYRLNDGRIGKWNGTKFVIGE